MLLSRLASRAAASGTRALLARAAQRNAPRRLLSEKPAEKAAEKAAAPEAKPGWWSTGLDKKKKKFKHSKKQF